MRTAISSLLSEAASATHSLRFKAGSVFSFAPFAAENYSRRAESNSGEKQSENSMVLLQLEYRESCIFARNRDSQLLAELIDGK
jgi:hypothetical protein